MTSALLPPSANGLIYTRQYRAYLPLPFRLHWSWYELIASRSVTDLETGQEALCSVCGRPLPRVGAPCRYCEQPVTGNFHIRPLFLVLVLIISAAFCTGTIFATRSYQRKQRKLGQMWFGRGQAALAAGQARVAVQDFRNALYYSHDSPEYRLRLAEALVASNHIREAQSYLITLWQDEPSNSTVNLQLARLAVRQGETQPALRYYHGAIYGLWPDGDAAALRQQTRLELIHYLLGMHDITQADAELIALTPELPRNPAVHNQVGRLFLQAGDEPRALQEFQQALRLNPKQATSLLGAGEAAFQLGHYRDAVQYLERALRAGEDDPKAEQLLATSRLILEWNPYGKGVSSRGRALRIVQAFRQATTRLNQCAAGKGVSLAAGFSSPEPPPSVAVEHSGTAPQSGLVGKLLGKIKPGEKPMPLASPSADTAAESKLRQLYVQISQLKPSVRVSRLERDPQLADSAMGVIAQIEMLTAQQCGAPTGPDLALLLLARQGEER
jgi:tetratricopeptide (TPR) repeat protein